MKEEVILKHYNNENINSKIREYITSRNIQYDLVGGDILKILDEEE